MIAIIRAGKQGKHAGGQEREPPGAKGGKGGQFTKKGASNTGVKQVDDAINAFRPMNAARVALYKATKGGASASELKKKQFAYDEARAKFSFFKNKAAKAGYMVDARGIWTNEAKSKPQKKAPTHDALKKLKSGELFDLDNKEYESMMASGRETLDQRKAILAAIKNPSERNAVRKRLNDLEAVVTEFETFKADKWNTGYTKQFSKHSHGMKKAGVFDGMTDELSRSGKFDNAPKDADGRAFDNIRGEPPPDSASTKMYNYLDNNGGDYNLLGNWATNQTNSSWSNNSLAMKMHMASQRDVPLDDYYWFGNINGRKQAEQYLKDFKDISGAKAYETNAAVQHAFTYNMLKQVAFDGNDQKNGTVSLLRTEATKVMANYRPMSEWEVGKKYTMTRGAMESSSVFTTFAGSTKLTVQNVPHHRVFATYFQGRQRHSPNTLFMSNGENEFVFMPEGIEFEYKGDIGYATQDRQDFGL